MVVENQTKQPNYCCIVWKIKENKKGNDFDFHCKFISQFHKVTFAVMIQSETKSMWRGKGLFILHILSHRPVMEANTGTQSAAGNLEAGTEAGP